MENITLQPMETNSEKFDYKKFGILLLIVVLTVLAMRSYAQTSIQNFGTGTGSHTSGTSTTFIPNPTSGTSYVRIGTEGGSINRENTSNPLGSSGTFIRAVAPTGTSVNKFTPVNGYTAGTSFYTKFKVLYGNSSGAAGVTSGNWSFYIGSGAMYADGNNFTGAQVFTGMRYTYSTSLLDARQGSGWSGANMSTNSFAQGVYYEFEIMGNNSSSTINYTYSGTSQSIAANTYDFYVNGQLIGDNVAKAQLANNANIDAITFIGVSSTSNAANIFVDDVVIYNSVPSAITNFTQPSPFDLSSGNYSLTSWANTNSVTHYPNNMVFHYGTLNTVDPALPNTGTSDYIRRYDLTSQSRINGLGANGFSFINTNPGNVTTTTGNLGEAVLGLNTTGRQNIQVSWVAARQTNNGNRYRLRGQYRVGNSGSYTDLPGAVADIEFNSTNAGPTNYGPITLPAACENQSEVQIRWVYYWGGSGSGARDEIRLDEISVTSSPLVSSGITTSSITGSPFCVGSSFGAAVNVPYTITGTFNAGNVFTAQLSDASGSFASPVNIGTLSSTSAGTISATIPAGTTAGTGYRIRVVSSNPVVTGTDNGANLSVQAFVAPTAVSSNCGNLSASVSWTNPACFDQILVVAKNAAFSSALPTGDGSAYTANLTYGSGTAFDGGHVVYKGTGTSTGTITSLAGNVLHYFKVFARIGTNWIEATPASCTPTNTCATENFANLPTANSTTYQSRSWTGTDGFTWTAEGARTDQSLNGKAICFGTSGNRWVTSHTYSNGIGTLSFSYVRGFTNTNTRNLQVWVNGVQIGGNISVSTTSDVPQTYSQTIDISGNVEVEIRSISAGQVIVDDISWSCFTTPCFTPTTHASGVTAASITGTSATINWTNGNGPRRIVVVREGSDVNADPVNNTTYSASASFGSGAQIGTGNFVVYDGSAPSSVNITNLVQGREYFVKIFEYGCTPGNEEYYITGAPGNVRFLTIPATPTGLTVGCRTPTTIDLSWTAPAGDFDGYLVVAREASGEHSVSSLNPVSQTFNTNYTSAPTFGSTSPLSRVVYKGTATSVTITNLTASSNTTFRVYTYKNVTAEYKYSSATSTTQNMSLQNVTLASATPNNQAALIFWTNPGSACFDEVLVVANTTPGIDFSPTGDGSAYTPNPVWAGNNSIVYKADFNTYAVDVSGLTNGTPYYFEIFVRLGTTWSSGVEVTATPTTATPFAAGDIAIIAVNTQYLSTGSDDEVCFFAFKDIEEGTSIEFTDNGYERATAGLWGDTEGTIRIQRTGGGTIPAGTVLCLRGAGNQASDFTIMNCGTNDNANWNIISLNGNFYSFDLNVSDQIWVFQNGAWSNPAGSHNATYTGNVVWGWTATGWQSAPGYNSTAGSTRPANTECFTLDLNGIPNKDKVKYTGPTSAASQVTWLQRIATVSNWTGYSSNTNYNAGGPNYGNACVTFNISSIGFTPGLWSGFTNTDWFNCRNWDNLRVPDENVDVTVPNVTNKPVIGSGVANTKNITLQSGSNLTMNNAASELRVHGNWVNNSGSTLSLTVNTSATVKFRSGNTQSVGGSSLTNFQRLIVENGTLLNINVNTQIGGNGLLEVTGTHSQLGAAANADLNIQGNSTFRLISGGAMNNSCLDNLSFSTGGNSSTATFTGNGASIKCYNFNSTKTTSGGIVFTTNTPFDVKNNFVINYHPGAAQWVDNGNTITIGDDLRLKGAASNFNLTGTITLTCANSGSGQADIEVESGNTTDAIQAHLHNLTINSTNNDANIRFQGLTGSNTITIKNNFTLQSMGTGREVRLHGNTLRVGGHWNNQVGQAAFNEGTSTVECNGTAPQQIDASGGEIFHRLRTNNSAGVQLQSAVQASQELIMSAGNISTGSHVLTLGNSTSQTGTLNRTSGRVIGSMRRWFAAAINTGDATGLFPLGNNLHDQFVRVEYTTAPTSGGTLTAFFNNQDMAAWGVPAVEPSIVAVGSCPTFKVTNLANEGYWDISEGNGLLNGLYDISFEAEGFSTINELCRLTALKRVGLGDWSQSGNHQEVLGTTSRPIVKRTSASGWSNWGFGGGFSNPLPIQLLHFNATPLTQQVQLDWTTASENNNHYFSIERSRDAMQYEVIHTQPGAGNSNQIIQYQTFDPHPYPGISYYRLRQTDFDGANVATPWVAVRFGNTLGIGGIIAQAEGLQVYFNDGLQSGTLSLFNTLGQRIHQQTLTEGANQVALPLQSLPHGIYLLVFEADGQRFTEKIRW